MGIGRRALIRGQQHPCGAMVVVALAVAFGTVATTEASNVAFHMRLSRTGSPAGTLYWVSIPYDYQPTDSQPNSLVDAEDLVQDLQPANLSLPCTAAANDCAVSEVWRWDPATGQYEVWTGGGTVGTPFELTAGAGYGLVVQEVGGVSSHMLDLVRAHNPAVELTACWQADAINMRWVSLPPHLSIDLSHGISGLLDAEDLGQAMGGPSRVVQVRQFNNTTGVFENWVVGSLYGTPFPIDLDQAYAIDLTCPNLLGGCGECTWTWVPAHY